VAWLLLGTRFSARMRDLAERFGRWRPLATLLCSVQYILATALLGFPLTLYEGFIREHRYGLSNQTFGEWLRDQLVGLAVSVVVGGLLLGSSTACSQGPTDLVAVGRGGQRRQP